MFFVFLILIGITLHRPDELHVAVLVRNPSGHYAPKVELAIVADFSHNDFYLAPINDGDDAPVFYGLAFADALLVTFHFKLFERLLVLLIGRRALHELHRSRQQFEAQYLRRALALAPRTFEDDVVVALGGEVNVIVQRGREYWTDAVVELLCVRAELFVVGQVFHGEQFTPSPATLV